ncbi:MAG: hypothetical protein ACI8QG_001569 [Flavobacteriales bacterium]|jgi:hypothetical protein
MSRRISHKGLKRQKNINTDKNNYENHWFIFREIDQHW